MSCLIIKGVLVYLIISRFLVHGSSIVEDILTLKFDGDSIVTVECKSVLLEVQKALQHEELWVVKCKFYINFCSFDSFGIGNYH